MTNVEQNDLQPAAAAINLGNWLSPPYNRVAFRRVRDLLPVASIENDPRTAGAFEIAPMDEARLAFTSRTGEAWSIQRYLDTTYTDGLLILRDGRIVFEWCVPGHSPNDEYLVFSVTKSIIGSLAGILVGKGQLDPQALIVNYVPEVRDSGFGRASVRDLLDMTVSLDFEEGYLVPDGPFARYREATGWHKAEPGRSTDGMHAFLSQIPATSEPHGTIFDYLSPNSDLLGWVCERAAETSLATLISELIWKPMGAEFGAFITMDHYGAPRAAGGFGGTLRDMARFGECMRNGGAAAGRQVIPKAWVEDIQTNANRSAWNKGAMADWVPGGGYRSQWYVTNNARGDYFAAGIFGQWIYISPAEGVVIVKQTSRPVGPADRDGFLFNMEALGSLAQRAGQNPGNV